jgi:hypothetical protein
MGKEGHMKRSILGGLAVLFLSAAVALPAQADPHHHHGRDRAYYGHRYYDGGGYHGGRSFDVYFEYGRSAPSYVYAPPPCDDYDYAYAPVPYDGYVYAPAPYGYTSYGFGISLGSGRSVHGRRPVYRRGPYLAAPVRWDHRGHRR